EKLGLILSISYCINAIIGLLQSSFSLTSPLSYLILVWIFVAMVVGSSKISKKTSVQKSNAVYVFSNESLLLFLTSFCLLLGSYGLAMALGPISGLLSGDIARYMVSTNESFHLGLSS